MKNDSFHKYPPKIIFIYNPDNNFDGDTSEYYE